MDPSIKKKPEKPRMRRQSTRLGLKWLCRCDTVMVLERSPVVAYQEWQRTRAALNKHVGK